MSKKNVHMFQYRKRRKIYELSPRWFSKKVCIFLWWSSNGHHVWIRITFESFSLGDFSLAPLNFYTLWVSFGRDFNVKFLSLLISSNKIQDFSTIFNKKSYRIIGIGCYALNISNNMIQFYYCVYLSPKYRHKNLSKRVNELEIFSIIFLINKLRYINCNLTKCFYIFFGDFWTENFWEFYFLGGIGYCWYFRWFMQNFPFFVNFIQFLQKL
jgi:hypothetical protein